MTDTGIGAAVRRVEDQRFITGAGNYVDDLDLPGQLYAAFVRSTHAHAELSGISTDAARAAPGVRAVLTGVDVAADGLGGMPVGWGITEPDGSPMVEPPWPIIAEGRVRFVGELVAVVVAQSLEEALDATERVAVDYRPRPAVVSTAGAAAAGAPQIWEEAADNTCFVWEIGDQGAVDDGGVVQGIGQALLEHGVYDEAGQLLSGSFMDYTMPRADDVPNFDTDVTQTRVLSIRWGPKAVERSVPSARPRRSSTRSSMRSVSTALPI